MSADVKPQFGDPRLPERFWKKCRHDKDTDCWIWTASARTKRGRGTNCDPHGRFWYQNKNLSSHRVAYEALVGPLKELCLDHILNCSTLCCNPAHLNPTTNKQNARRQKIRPGSSNFKGVFWRKRSAKWNAQIYINMKGLHLGMFESEFDAARTYDRAAIKLHGPTKKHTIINFEEERHIRQAEVAVIRFIEALSAEYKPYQQEAYSTPHLRAQSQMELSIYG